MSKGFVSLVGAGPGDPELITVKGLRRLRAADVVIYDALANEALLRECRADAELIYAGKRAGQHYRSQDEINRLLLEKARAGLQVVRLKGGDPFVFGRGAEEALALRAANVPFEVVPGVSSAIAAPALASIPVTHRGLATAFTVIAGHAAASYTPVLDAIRPGATTLVFLMSLGQQRQIAAALVARGWRPATPAAILLAASRDDAEAWTGTIASLAARQGTHDPERPGMIVVGDVVSVREQLLAQPAAAAGSAR
jgi:uroporphyrin-III C-methyltransferase/precorrin-2 dehydrogenase/sirohydrochlorin ferrochelatase